MRIFPGHMLHLRWQFSGLPAWKLVLSVAGVLADPPADVVTDARVLLNQDQQVRGLNQWLVANRESIAANPDDLCRYPRKLIRSGLSMPVQIRYS